MIVYPEEPGIGAEGKRAGVGVSPGREGKGI